MMRQMISGLLIGLLVCCFSAGCSKEAEKMKIKKEKFGRLPDGRVVESFVLSLADGTRARIMTYGAILISLEVPDRDGQLDDVVLGYDDLTGYLKNEPYFGATVGRYANRIAAGRFVLDGVEFRLARNNGPNHLHGGVKGFNKVLWDGEAVRTRDGIGVRLHYVSRDGEEGYPGNLTCTVTYLLSENRELRIDYHAVTDRPTPVNLSHHSYFNLAGEGARDILCHVLFMDADRYTPVDDGLIPTGELKPVAGTPFDFTVPTAIGDRIDQVDGGYDHNYVLNAGGGDLAVAARVAESSSGRVLEVKTTEPGMQFYTGNFLDGSELGKRGKPYMKHYGFCLETQHFPDSPNRPAFPSVILRPGETYHHTTIYAFSAR